MEKKINKQKMILLVACISILLVGMTGGYVSLDAKEEAAGLEQATEYVLYIGLNDKDTYDQIISTQEAIQKINTICTKYVTGYTIVETQGGWVDEKNMLTQENTLVYYFRGACESDICAIMDEVLLELNQNTIMMEERTVFFTYYGGILEKEPLQEGGVADDKERE